MKKIINGMRYDTETARARGWNTNGLSVRDLGWMTEELYQKRSGEFFLHGEGGPATRYAEKLPTGGWTGGEDLIPLTEDEARRWVEDNLGSGDYEMIFGDPGDGGGDPAARAKEIREITGLNMTKFAEKYGIPYRTLQNWEAGVTVAPEYVLDLLAKVVATDAITPHVWVVETYRDKGGIGSEKIFHTKTDAIRYARDEWDHMSAADRRSYTDDPAGMFYVGLKPATWDDIAEEWVTEGSPDAVVWDALEE